MQAPWWWSKTETCRSDIYVYFNVNFNVLFKLKSAFVGDWTLHISKCTEQQWKKEQKKCRQKLDFYGEAKQCTRACVCVRVTEAIWKFSSTYFIQMSSQPHVPVVFTYGSIKRKNTSTEREKIKRRGGKMRREIKTKIKMERNRKKKKM